MCSSDLLDRHYRQLQARLGDPDGTDRLHQLRISAKKLRYVTEFFAELYPRKKVRRFLRPLANLQEVLGAFNDTCVAQQMVSKAAEGVRPLDPQARGMALGWIAAGQAQVVPRIEASARAPLKAASFWE